MERLFIVGLVLAIAGCAAPVHYTPPAGATDQEQYRDMADCREKAAISRAGGYNGKRTYIYCLRGKGWTVE